MARGRDPKEGRTARLKPAAGCLIDGIDLGIIEQLCTETVGVRAKE